MLKSHEAKLMLLKKRLLNHSNELIDELNKEIQKSIDNDKNKTVIALDKSMSNQLRSNLFEYIELHGYRIRKNPDYIIEGKYKRSTNTDEYTELEIIW